MRLKVEFADDAAAYLRKCTQAEREEFIRRLDEVRLEPVKHSYFVHQPDVSRYVLRRFQFGSHEAIFSLDVGRHLIRVVLCRRHQSKPNSD
jgi:hypothetical protein